MDTSLKWAVAASPYGVHFRGSYWTVRITIIFANIQYPFILTITDFASDFYLPAIATGLDSSFNKDQDILVLPLDLQKFDTHEKLTQDVLKHFGKVRHNIIIIRIPVM